MSTQLNRGNSSSTALPTMAAAIAVAMLALTPAWAAAHEPAAASGMTMPEGQMDHSKMMGMKHMDGMSMTGNADYDFAVNMKMHHQMAIEMSKAEIKNGKSPQMVKMARRIAAAQAKEIAAFDNWLAANKMAMPDGMQMPK